MVTSAREDPDSYCADGAARLRAPDGSISKRERQTGSLAGVLHRLYDAQFPQADLSEEAIMIRKLASGEYRLYSRKRNPRTGKRRNLGTFKTRAAAEKHERAVQFFKSGR
jgi:hypothetical protein